ncbi:alpha,alpha-trehalase TreF [Novosphingobium aquae]|uniref:Alpha,alpha-trehalase TreF n=1 Tax=Novosphingobium aquae TaxID=3133435 RepID=A0ABU8SBA0_9SPHN
MTSAPESTPQELYGALLAAVQEGDILADGKTFVDALPRRPIPEIMADFARLPRDEEELARFVMANFELPSSVASSVAARANPDLPLRAYIRAMWSELARDPAFGGKHSSALSVRHRHVVPGGRFREMYYWDSFFTMLGLLRDGETELANGIVEAMTDLIEEHGHVPNGARSYFLGRSQPPLFHMMVALLDDRRPEIAARRLAAMKREHAWWMAGADGLAPGEQRRHVARLADGALVNRYWDPRDTPRDESWREDVATATASGRPLRQVYRDLRAGAESGWDFSSRWLDGPDLGSIRTTIVAPIDLNAFLFGLESTIAAMGDADDAKNFGRFAQDRRTVLHRYFWNAESGYFADFDLELNQPRKNSSAAALTPLLVGLATQSQAEATARYVRENYLAPGGLRTTLVASGEQWDQPNGWAPLQWIAVTGLSRYGHEDLALEIARRWVDTVDQNYQQSGLIYEKYDVEAGAIGAGGEYAPQTGFGWTNGVTADFLDSCLTKQAEMEGNSCSQA